MSNENFFSSGWEQKNRRGLVPLALPVLVYFESASRLSTGEASGTLVKSVFAKLSHEGSKTRRGKHGSMPRPSCLGAFV